MSLPSLTFQVINPGSSARRVLTEQVPIYVGVAESGDLDTVQSFGQFSDVVAEYTRGHLVDVANHAFACGATSVQLCRVTAAVAGASETVDTTAANGTLTVSGTLSQRLRCRAEITGTGAQGVATFRYSLDFFEIAGVDPTWSADTLIPLDGIFAVPGTAMVWTFDDTAGDFTDGELFTFNVWPGHYGATEIAGMADAVRESTAGDATDLVFTGEPPAGVANAGAVTAATNTSAIASLIASLFATADFFGALNGASEATAASCITAHAGIVATPPFLSPGYSKAYVTNPSATPARGMLALGEVEAVYGSRIAGSGISEDPARTASGALARVVATNYDVRTQGGALEAARISSLRTYQRRLSPGVFVARQRLLDAPTGDFYTWPHSACMIAALRAVHPVAWLAIAEGFRQKAGGFLDPTEIVSLKSACDRALGAALLEPLNVRGIPGHVSAASATPRADVALPAVQIDFRIRPLGYAEDITFTLQYAGEV